jgi:hypothetical protein
VSEEAAPERIAVIWSPEARSDLRAIDRETALQILPLRGPLPGQPQRRREKAQAATERLPAPL